MPAGPIGAMRITLFGVQGSGSVYPTEAERAQMREVMECHLLEEVFRYLSDQEGRICSEVEDMLGGPPTPDTIRRFRRRFTLPEPRSYGGWTTCIHVETADGFDIVLDCGSGFRTCADMLQRKWGDRPERELHVFGSHSHSDHTEGFDQAAVCFDRRNRIRVYGNSSFLRALDSYLGIFTRWVHRSQRGLRSPITYDVMPATFESVEILEKDDPVNGTAVFGRKHLFGEPIEIGATRIIPFEVHHPAPCLAYRIEHGEAAFVFCTDHELRRGESDPELDRASREAEERLIEYATGADLLYRDGQYLEAEYEGEVGIGESVAVPRLGWGHSCLEDVERMAVEADVRLTLIGHHDPNRPWGERNRIDEALARNNRARAAQVELARAEIQIDL